SMDQVVEHEAGDLVARVQAGATIGQLAVVLGSAGQQLALDVPAEATVGGVVATGTAGPRRFRYGTPRGLLIGIPVVRADAGAAARRGAARGHRARGGRTSQADVRDPRGAGRRGDGGRDGARALGRAAGLRNGGARVVLGELAGTGARRGGRGGCRRRGTAGG